MGARSNPIRFGLPEGKIAWPVRVTAVGGQVLDGDETPGVKIHYGRLGRFFRRADLPPFHGVEAWFLMRIENGRFYIGPQVPAPEKAVPLPMPPATGD